MRMSFQPAIKIDRILSVDDTPTNLALIEAILEEEGYAITSVDRGAAALEIVKNNPPDLILLDVMMPEIDGYEVTRQVRQMNLSTYVPILLITAHDHADVVCGLDAGADEFVRKPVDADELIARVRSLLRLKRSIDEREQMILQRQDFIAHLTHDLRTPLVAADMMLKLFRKEAFCPLSPEMHEAVGALIRSNQNLLEMVNTLLEVQSYDAGAKKFTPIPCNLWEISQEVVQQLAPIAEDKGIELKLELIGKNLEDLGRVTVTGDCLELHRMLGNLIGNSLKFTDKGFVHVQLIPVPEGDRTLLIKVQDSGPGIPADEIAGLFQRFRKGNHKQAGSGLGLHLVQRILEVHDGSISVESELGQGSTFTVQLPIEASVSQR